MDNNNIPMSVGRIMRSASEPDLSLNEPITMTRMAISMVHLGHMDISPFEPYIQAIGEGYTPPNTPSPISVMRPLMIRGVFYNASRFVTLTPTRSFPNVPSVSPMSSIPPMSKSVVNYSNVVQTQLRLPMIDIPGPEGQRQWWNMLTFLPLDRDRYDRIRNLHPPTHRKFVGTCHQPDLLPATHWTLGGTYHLPELVRRPLIMTPEPISIPSDTMVRERPNIFKRFRRGVAKFGRYVRRRLSALCCHSKIHTIT